MSKIYLALPMLMLAVVCPVVAQVGAGVGTDLSCDFNNSPDPGCWGHNTQCPLGCPGGKGEYRYYINSTIDQALSSPGGGTHQVFATAYVNCMTNSRCKRTTVKHADCLVGAGVCAADDKLDCIIGTGVGAPTQVINILRDTMAPCVTY